MGRRKLYSRRFLIGLNECQANTLVAMSNWLGLTYSEFIAYLMDRYQLGEDKDTAK